jgi:predicted nucleic acid-binding protein
MKYLLDVNALIAWEHPRSVHHLVFHRWAKQQGAASLVSCALSELGFMRVSMQVFGYSLADAQTALAGIKSQLGGFLLECPSPQLPVWATTAGRSSDAYLLQLASTHALSLATFDAGIPGASVIT